MLTLGLIGDEFTSSTVYFEPVEKIVLNVAKITNINRHVVEVKNNNFIIITYDLIKSQV